MNILANFLSEQFIQTFGWTLLHSLWQGAIVALLYGITMVFLKKHSSKLRYYVSLIALLIIPIMFVVTFLSIYPDTETVSTSNTGSMTVLTKPVDAALLKTYFYERDTQSFFKDLFNSTLLYFNKHLPLLVMMWLLGMMIFSLRFLGGLAYTQRLKHHRTYEVPDRWKEKLAEMCSTMKLSKPVKMFESAITKVPMIIGYFKPVILVPLGTFSHVPADQLEAIISHELTHIIRKDYLVNIIQSVIEVFFFFHPAVWWISKNIRIEREYHCDDMTLDFYNDPLIYVKALANIKEMETNVPRFATAFYNGKDQLMARIQRMISRPRVKPNFSEGIIIAVFLIFGILTISSTAAISLRENNYDKFTENVTKMEEQLNHSKGDQPVHLNIYPASESEKIEKIQEPEGVDPDINIYQNTEDINDDRNINRMEIVYNDFMTEGHKPVIIPDTGKTKKEIEHEEALRQYEKALVKQEEAEKNMREAKRMQREATEEYERVVREQREVIREKIREAQKEYQHKLQEIYKDDTLRSSRYPSLRYSGFDYYQDWEEDWDLDVDWDQFVDSCDTWTLAKPLEDMIFYSTPDTWTLFEDAHNDLLNDKILDEDIIIYGGKLNDFYHNENYEAFEDLMLAQQLEFSKQSDLIEGISIPYGEFEDLTEGLYLESYFDINKVEKIFKSELLKDDLIEKGEDYIVEINSKSLIINGEKQTREVHKKYKRLIESAIGDEIEEGRTYIF